jgi:rhodanese-related sulfurtransferase
MAQNITTGVRQLVEAANAQIESISAEDAMTLVEDPDVQIVDLRDVRELKREGKIPGSLHVPRGMLEFWVDPASPYYKPVFNEDKKFVFHCASGWRSALATLAVQNMGLKPVCHIATGFSGWVKAGGAVEKQEKKD